MTPPSKFELNCHSAYGGSLNRDEASSRSTIASFMAIEELGGLLGSLDDEEAGQEGQLKHQPEAESKGHVLKKREVYPADLESGSSGTLS